MTILLPTVLFLSWLAFVLVPAVKLAIEDEINEIPEQQRRGTSIMPVFPILPLILWGIAWLLNRMIASWTTWCILIGHLLLLAASAIILARDTLRLREIARKKVKSDGKDR